MTALTSSDFQRYARHLTLSEVGIEGQKKLKQSKVCLVGLGGLGSPLAYYLAAAGVGSLTLIDGDVVDESNLQRQILHSSSFVGKEKTESAHQRLSDYNPHIQLQVINERLSAENVKKHLSGHHLICDGSDNFTCRYLVNDASYFLKTPLLSGSILSFEGQLMLFNFENGPCYRCLYPSPPPPEAAPNCAQAGVLGVLPGVLGTLQATEAIKILLGLESSLNHKICHYDALTLSLEKFDYKKSSHCPLCGNNPIVTEIKELAAVCSSEEEKDHLVSYRQWEANRERYHMVDVREESEREQFYIKGSSHHPLSDLETEIDSKDSSSTVLFYCHSGVRSEQAVKKMKALGVEAKSLKGGILEGLVSGHSSIIIKSS